MKKFFLVIFISLGFQQSVFSHHGPFSNEDKLAIHQLHLGITTTTDPNGIIKNFGIRACSTKELDFVRPWRSSKKGTIPFKINTEDIVAFGLSVNVGSGLGNHNAAGLISAVTNPISIPLSIIRGGSKDTFQYSILTLNKKNGRVAQRNITLYSQEDVNYLNQYLNLSTGYNHCEQLTYIELENKFKVLKDKSDLENNNECSYMEKYGYSETIKKKSKESIQINCDSPVWKNKPRCN